MKNSEIRTREYLTPNEVEQLAEAARRRGRYGSRDALAIRLAARHGLRISEVTELTWDQVDFIGGLLHVKRKKNGVPSIHPLKGEEIRALRALRRANAKNPDGSSKSPGRFVFMTERGAPFSTDGLAKIVERAGKAARFAFPVHFHMLRHACGYYYANQGKDTRSLQHWLGHRNISHTVRYTELSAQHFKDW